MASMRTCVVRSGAIPTRNVVATREAFWMLCGYLARDCFCQSETQIRKIELRNNSFHQLNSKERLMSVPGLGIASFTKCMASHSSVALGAREISVAERQVSNAHSIGAPRIVRLASKAAQLESQLSRCSSSSWSANRKLARCVTRGPSQNLSSELPDELKAPTSEDEVLGPLDELLLKTFRAQMAVEVGWESPRAGFGGLLEVVKHLYVNSSKPEVEKAVVRVFTALFPSFVVKAFRNIILPVGSGKPGAILMAYVTQAATRWLMGPSVVNQVTLADGSTLPSGVLVERCKFLEGSQCAGICIHMCKVPTQAFIKDVMGVSLAMEPNFNDFSCQFNFGVEAIPRDQDPGLQTPCLSICPTAAARATLRHQARTDQCPQVQ